MSDDDATALKFMLTACLALALSFAKMPVAPLHVSGVKWAAVLQAGACAQCDAAAISLAP